MAKTIPDAPARPPLAQLLDRTLVSPLRLLATRRAEAPASPADGPRYPFSPYPRGWFVVARAEDLRAGEVRNVRFGGRPWVLWRSRGGRASLIAPTCPHLGAHFGHGSEVVGESLQCPMHRFRYDHEGACVETGYGTKPPACRATTLAVREDSGYLLALHDPDGALADFAPPELARPEWGDGAHFDVVARTHPHDLAENLVDPGHFAHTHGYEDVSQTGGIETEGHVCTSRFVVHRSADMYGKAMERVRVEMTCRLHGLGLFVIDSVTNPGDVHVRMVAAPTPVDEDRVDFRFSIWIRDLDRARRASKLFGAMPERHARRVLLGLVKLGMRHDVEQDLRILDHKRYLERPALAAGDGQFRKFRDWTRQFHVWTEGPSA
ncbi:MAG: Rieske 2Fe-2S domain-containing protein [Polyangiales bacterium]